MSPSKTKRAKMYIGNKEIRNLESFSISTEEIKELLKETVAETITFIGKFNSNYNDILDFPTNNTTTMIFRSSNGEEKECKVKINIQDNETISIEPIDEDIKQWITKQITTGNHHD